MKNFITIIALFFSVINFNNAQELEIGVFLGISNYQGDLMANHFEAQEHNLGYGLFARYRFNEFLAVKGGFNKGSISGDDKWGQNRSRNLSFKSDITEISLVAEFNIIPLITDELNFLSIYGFAGIAGFHFNPQTLYKGQWIDLQPLGTEGQSANPYSLYQISIPMGIGGSIRINDVTSLGLEVGLRKTFTDHLDDVSGNYADVQSLGKESELAALLSYRTPEVVEGAENFNPAGTIRGNSAKKDWYMFIGGSLSVNLSNLLALGGGPGRYSAF